MELKVGIIQLLNALLKLTGSSNASEIDKITGHNARTCRAKGHIAFGHTSVAIRSISRSNCCNRLINIVVAKQILQSF